MKVIWIISAALLSFNFLHSAHAQCQERNTTAANEVGRPCRKPCLPDNNRCRGGKTCECDHECGYSCLHPVTLCRAPSHISNMARVEIRRRVPDGSLVLVSAPPYRYDDVAEYVCVPGYSREEPLMNHHCHGRRDWTGTTICALENLCLSSPCLNRGVCSGNRTSYTCVCREEFGGRNCETDFSECGQAGDVGSIKQQARVGRVLGGTNAADRAWPWHVVISIFTPNVYEAFQKRHLLGAGSLLNHRWILSVNDIFRYVPRPIPDVLLTLGLHSRPLRRGDILPSHVQIFTPRRIITHPNASSANNTLDYDIALIQVGQRYNQVGQRFVNASTGGFVTYSYYVRPVCLPCTENSCVRSRLLRQGLLTGRETEEQKCNVEARFLLEENRDSSVMLGVIIGFGHTKRLNPSARKRLRLPVILQQALQRILDDHTCEDFTNLIRVGFPEFPASLRYTDRMLCATSGIAGRVLDSCLGDSGGALVREVYNEHGGKAVSCWVQIGMVSWGWGCGQTIVKNGIRQQVPGYYTNVIKLSRWINATLKANEI